MSLLNKNNTFKIMVINDFNKILMEIIQVIEVIYQAKIQILKKNLKNI